MKINALGSSLLLVASWVAHAGVQTDAATQDVCNKPWFSVLVVDDHVNSQHWMQELIRQYRLPSPASLLRQELGSGGCVLVLDPDPALTSMPNIAQPDLLLRTRVISLVASETTLGQRAGTAIGRYISSYFGGNDDEIPVLRAVELAIDIICVRQRRAINQLTVQVSNADSTKADTNGETLARACARARQETLEYLRQRPLICDRAL